MHEIFFNIEDRINSRSQVIQKQATSPIRSVESPAQDGDEGQNISPQVDSGEYCDSAPMTSLSQDQNSEQLLASPDIKVGGAFVKEYLRLSLSRII